MIEPLLAPSFGYHKTQHPGKPNRLVSVSFRGVTSGLNPIPACVADVRRGKSDLPSTVVDPAAHPHFPLNLWMVRETIDPGRFVSFLPHHHNLPARRMGPDQHGGTNTGQGPLRSHPVVEVSPEVRRSIAKPWMKCHNRSVG